MKQFKKEKGSISLEACIVVPMFIFLMLFLYSFFMTFQARNEIGHVVLATANSMSLDAYANKKIGASGKISQVVYNVYDIIESSDSPFNERSQWYDDSTTTAEDGTTSLSSDFSKALSERFQAYLTDGDLTKTDQVLKKYHIVGGLSGLDFSGSHVDGDKLYVKVKYKMEYEFKLFGFDSGEYEQSACSRLWKD